MNRAELIAHIKRMIAKANMREIEGNYAQIHEFLRLYAGPQNSFIQAVESWNPRTVEEGAAANQIARILQAYLEFVEAGLDAQISPERQAQIDVVRTSWTWRMRS